jgi:SRSO17 transposase
MPPRQRLRPTTWSKLDRVFSNGDTELRYMRDIIFGQRRAIRYYHSPTAVEEQPPDSTWLIMTNRPGTMKKTVGYTSGRRPWIDYGLKQSKNALGWAEFRLTDYAESEKWGAIVCRAYRMVSWQSSAFKARDFLSHAEKASVLEKAISVVNKEETQEKFQQHTWWEQGKGWKNTLNNLRLMLQPYVSYCLLWGWLEVFDLPFLKGGFTHVIARMNAFTGFVPV